MRPRNSTWGCVIPPATITNAAQPVWARQPRAAARALLEELRVTSQGKSSMLAAESQAGEAPASQRRDPPIDGEGGCVQVDWEDGAQMPRPLVSDELWELVEPLIPKVPRRQRFPGRKLIDDRKVLAEILFVLRTGIPWEYLPQEMGCGSGATCWRRLQEWQQAGVWQRLHALLLAKLHEADDRLGSGGDRHVARAGIWGRQDRPEPR